MPKSFSSKDTPHGCPNVSINITKTIMAKSIRNTIGKCMLATAIRSWAAKKGWSVWSISISAELIKFNMQDTASDTGHSKFMWETPTGPASLLKAWDEGKAIAPFRFVLRASQGTRRPVNRRMPRKKDVTITATVEKPGRVRNIKVEKNRTERKPRKGGPRRDCIRRWAGLRIITRDGASVEPGHVAWRNGR